MGMQFHKNANIVIYNVPERIVLYVEYLIWDQDIKINSVKLTLREKCPNTELFLVRIFPHSDQIRRDTKNFSEFSPNTGKYGSEKTLYLDNFHTVLLFTELSNAL